MVEDSYRTILQTAESLFKDRGSRFIGYCYHVESEQEVKAIIAALKKTHHDATHICYAYLIGKVGTPAIRMNDDGEPSGTAGKPIYGQILSANLKDVLIVSVRYFGGTKLGVSGLINAYKESAKASIANAAIRTLNIKHQYLIFFDYTKMNLVMQVLKHPAVEIKENTYEGEKIKIRFDVVISHSQAIKEQLEAVRQLEISHLGFV